MLCGLIRFPVCAISPRSRVPAEPLVWSDLAGRSGRAEKFKVPAGLADSSSPINADLIFSANALYFL